MGQVCVFGGYGISQEFTVPWVFLDVVKELGTKRFICLLDVAYRNGFQRHGSVNAEGREAIPQDYIDGNVVQVFVNGEVPS